MATVIGARETGTTIQQHAQQAAQYQRVACSEGPRAIAAESRVSVLSRRGARAPEDGWTSPSVAERVRELQPVDVELTFLGWARRLLALGGLL